MASQHGRAHAPARPLRDVFHRDSLSVKRSELNPEEYVYNTGDVDDAMYFIEAGQVKVFMSSASGQDCLLAIHTAGDVFGETCFAGAKRFEIAQAMEPTVVLRVTRKDLVAEVRRAEMMDALLRHLGSRIAERQIAVFDLATMDSERRLAKVLLHLSEKLGVAEGPWHRIDQISQEDLSQMVGTTRPRVTAFMQRFRQLGLVDTPVPRTIRVQLDKTRRHLEAGES